MRQVLLFAFFMLASAVATAQSNGQVKVVRNDGTTIIGTIQSADSSGITLTIAEIAMTIPMAEVQSIEECSSPAEGTQSNSSPFAALPSDQYGDYVITDYGDYPEAFTITVAGQTFTMILVRGGVFNMGYDGKGSIFMDTEPVHKVAVSSFYMSKEYCTNATAYAIAYTLLGKNYIGTAYEDYLSTSDWDWAYGIAAAVARVQGAPYRLLTEAEWEYAAILPTADYLFHNVVSDPFFKRGNRIGEWCSDYWGKYSENSEVNPQGPSAGTKHVARCYTKDEYRWCRDRKKINKNADPNKYFVRIAISADQIPAQ